MRIGPLEGPTRSNARATPQQDGIAAPRWVFEGRRGGAATDLRGRKAREAMAKTVLIVEDNELNMKLFNDLLHAHGYETLQTRDGREAFKIARDRRPDLILMDIQLPEVSGRDVTKWLKEDDELCSSPVIAVTAFAMKGDEERFRAGGCEAYISKPISVSDFLDTVDAFIGDGGP